MQVVDSGQCQSKQLVFDCRYGWVYDEWRDPARIAHLGGRGMFSIVPLTAGAVGKTVDLVNKAADVVADILQDPPSLQADLLNLHVKAEKNFKMCLGNIMSKSVSKASRQASEKTSGFDQDLRNFKGKVTFKYELLENYVGLVRPVLI